MDRHVVRETPPEVVAYSRCCCGVGAWRFMTLAPLCRRARHVRSTWWTKGPRPPAKRKKAIKSERRAGLSCHIKETVEPSAAADDITALLSLAGFDPKGFRSLKNGKGHVGLNVQSPYWDLLYWRDLGAISTSNKEERGLHR